MIRKAKLNDFKEVFRLLNQLWPDEKISKDKSNKIYSELLKNKNSISLIIIENKNIVGYASVTFRNDFQSQGRIGYLSELIIDEKSRGKGLGTILLKEIMKESKKLGAIEIQFPSTFKREKAHKFYDSIGFHKTAYFFWKEL